MKLVKKALKGLAIVSGLVALVLLLSNIWVVKSTESKVFSDYHKVPENKVALVLGTSNKLTNGSPNPYFNNRIATAATLYKEGKVAHLIVSGDNRTILS